MFQPYHGLSMTFSQGISFKEFRGMNVHRRRKSCSLGSEDHNTEFKTHAVESRDILLISLSKPYSLCMINWKNSQIDRHKLDQLGAKLA